MRRRVPTCEAVEQDDGFVVCAEAADGAAAVQAALRKRPDLCLLDIRMPGSGIAATREITSRVAETKVVLITVSLDEDDLLNALRAGARSEERRVGKECSS